MAVAAKSAAIDHTYAEDLVQATLCCKGDPLIVPPTPEVEVVTPAIASEARMTYFLCKAEMRLQDAEELRQDILDDEYSTTEQYQENEMELENARVGYHETRVAYDKWKIQAEGGERSRQIGMRSEPEIGGGDQEKDVGECESIQSYHAQLRPGISNGVEEPGNSAGGEITVLMGKHLSVRLREGGRVDYLGALTTTMTLEDRGSTNWSPYISTVEGDIMDCDDPLLFEISADVDFGRGLLKELGHHCPEEFGRKLFDKRRKPGACIKLDCGKLGRPIYFLITRMGWYEGPDVHFLDAALHEAAKMFVKDDLRVVNMPRVCGHGGTPVSWNALYLNLHRVMQNHDAPTHVVVWFRPIPGKGG